MVKLRQEKQPRIFLGFQGWSLGPNFLMIYHSDNTRYFFAFQDIQEWRITEPPEDIQQGIV